MTIKIGADPEFFVRRGRHFVSGHEFSDRCGTKRQPKETEHGYVQVDGVALEVNVRPSDNRDSFVYNVTHVLNDLRRVAGNAELVVRPSVFLGSRFLNSVPPENARLGCEPDWNAYTGRINPRPKEASPIRTASGHVHIGWTEGENHRKIKHFEKCRVVARQLDFFLGLPSLLWDTDNRRRSLYGKAGAFRPKPYGVEYRVLSNAWLADQNRIGWVFDRSVAAYASVDEGRLLEKEYGGFAAAMIDSGNVDWPREAPELAKELLV